jgi:hypothetical protein
VKQSKRNTKFSPLGIAKVIVTCEEQFGESGRHENPSWRRFQRLEREGQEIASLDIILLEVSLQKGADKWGRS